MKVSPTDALVTTVNKEVSYFSNSYSIKSLLGDSVTNNRVPSIRQTIRFLNQTSMDSTLSLQLDSVYSFLLKKGFFTKLRRNKRRTDAYDINEFFTVINRYVNKNPNLKGQVTKIINAQ